MREKIKSHKIRVIITISVVAVIALSIGGIYLYNNTLLSKDTDKVVNELDNKKENDKLDETVEDTGEESTTKEEREEVSNTPKSESDKKSNNQSTNSSNSNTNKESTSSSSQTTQQSTITSKQDEVVNNNSNSSNSSNQSQTNTETTDLYNSITHGQWEKDINDNKDLCEAKGVNIANKELQEILDWNELHEDDQKQPIINYSRCYPVIKDGITHWYLHFFTTKGEGMDAEIKNKYQ